MRTFTSSLQLQKLGQIPPHITETAEKPWAGSMCWIGRTHSSFSIPCSSENPNPEEEHHHHHHLGLRSGLLQAGGAEAWPAPQNWNPCQAPAVAGHRCHLCPQHHERHSCRGLCCKWWSTEWQSGGEQGLCLAEEEQEPAPGGAEVETSPLPRTGGTEGLKNLNSSNKKLLPSLWLENSFPWQVVFWRCTVVFLGDLKQS